MALYSYRVWEKVLKTINFHYKISFKRFRFEFMQFTLLQSVRKCHYQPKAQKLVYKPVFESKEKKIQHNTLISSLQNCQSVDEQIKVFHSMVKLPDESINSRLSLCQDLEKVLQPYFLSPLSVRLLGSSINGFGFRGCDVDLSLQFLAEDNNEIQSAVKSSLHDKTEKVSVNKVFAAKNKLLTVRKIMQELKFEEPLTVVPGRCPILSFSFQGFPCDLSINNNLALRASNLMILCGKLDERVIPLMQVIIYWAKHFKLVGGHGRFKTYAISLMVIYFLQTRNPPILPSVKTMFQKTEFLKNLENWSYDITKDVSLFGKSQNNETVAELLREFFIFYGNFDFSYIICPISSCATERKVFTTKTECDKNFELNTICIQDPLNLSWNVTTGVNWKQCKNFLKAIVSMWQKYQDEMSCLPTANNVWGLSCIIDSHYDSKNLFTVTEFAIPLTLTLSKDCAQENALSCLKQATSHVKYILNYCLDFECHSTNRGILLTSVEIPQNVKSACENLLSEVDVYSPENGFLFSPPLLLDHFICSTRDTWLGRNTYLFLPDLPENVFERERKISDKLKQERDSAEKETFYFLCQCYGVFVEDKLGLEVKFSILNSDRFVPKLVIFLKDYIPKMMSQFHVEKRRQ